MKHLLIAAFAVLLAANTVADGLGIPSRDPQLDVLSGFKNPPPGYGEVPFWWWTGPARLRRGAFLVVDRRQTGSRPLDRSAQGTP